MKHAVAHDLSLESAKKAATAALEAYSARFAEYNPSITWLNDYLAEVQFKVKGVSLKGTFAILDKSIEMDMEVPMLLRMFKQKAIDVVEGEINKWIDKARTGAV
jgi:hypothetical protein